MDYKRGIVPRLLSKFFASSNLLSTAGRDSKLCSQHNFSVVRFLFGPTKSKAPMFSHRDLRFCGEESAPSSKQKYGPERNRSRVTKSFVHSSLRYELQKPKCSRPRLVCFASQNMTPPFDSSRKQSSLLSSGTATQNKTPSKKDGVLFWLCGPERNRTPGLLSASEAL
ncbi:MAG: hypothetical protein UR79_C0002G0211 [Candidatus Campbellbacteria bacterium GW2011_GWD1_35_49]|nr:MAG: hypothetical protein UR74_C0002G0122 [Candidatus Campbellbacteria bacterium GW2011_GWD2_35_24]KKP75742.1 MAG: hypothetical protein UR75_C0002G0123 [Candidatus Campbellbacteria bacterium GW2011_GWC2_35_28]KKP77010.1 MAG: hypothetical protein UR76_C0002G0211 [Candidatus Campbellbacteria bacterium GW2011_GWC1_35_31]KKP78936.1 MAG: hypothetical protein UR79_C0002G0211 [Candidatus Campbellbacteria bacterium GW2011_GWD1_35_49]